MEKRPTLRFLAGREDAGSTPDPAAPKLFGEFSKELIINIKNRLIKIFELKNFIHPPLSKT